MGLNSRNFFPRMDPGLVQAGKAFCLYQDNPSIADTSEHPQLLFKNASSGTSAVTAIIYSRRLEVRAAFTGTLRYYLTPTVTVNGTPAVPSPRLVGGPASAVSVFTGSTISANGTLIDLLSSYNYNPTEMADAPIVVPAGSAILVTYQASNTGATFLDGLDWIEVS